MNLTILGATGGTGRELTGQALERGHPARHVHAGRAARSGRRRSGRAGRGGSGVPLRPLSDGPLSPARRTLDLAGAPRRLFPARVSRATVAAAMLDEAETRAHPGQTLVPVDR